MRARAARDVDAFGAAGALLAPTRASWAGGTDRWRSASGFLALAIDSHHRVEAPRDTRPSFVGNPALSAESLLSGAGSWSSRPGCACAHGADPTGGTNAAGELPARLQATGARPRHVAARRAAHALDRQSLREGDQARAIRGVLRRRLASEAPRDKQDRRQHNSGPARSGERPYVAQRAAHFLAGTGLVITHQIYRRPRSRISVAAQGQEMHRSR